MPKCTKSSLGECTSSCLERNCVQFTRNLNRTPGRMEWHPAGPNGYRPMVLYFGMELFPTQALERAAGLSLGHRPFV